MKTLVLELEDDIYNHLEVRAAIDDQRIKPAVEKLLTEIVLTHKSRMELPVKRRVRNAYNAALKDVVHGICLCRTVVVRETGTLVTAKKINRNEFSLRIELHGDDAVQH